MENYTDEQKQEIIKSLAYGYTAEQIADNEGVEVDVVAKFAEENADAVEEMKSYLKEEGWLDE